MKFGRLRAAAICGALATVVVALLATISPTRATTLASWTDSNPDGAYALPFIANAANTTITFGGYNLPSFDNVSLIGLFLNGIGPNLLGGTWDFVPAPSGSLAFTFDDGSSVPGLVFGGTTVGSYDTFSQTIATTIGNSYTLQFDSEGFNTPNGFFAEASDASAAETPLPAALPLFATGLGALGLLGWRRKRKAQAVA